MRAFGRLTTCGQPPWRPHADKLCLCSPLWTLGIPLQVYEGIQQVHYLWTAPLEAIAILGLLTYLTKVYALPAYVIVFGVVLLQYYAGFLISKAKKAIVQKAASRVALAQEVLPAMKLVKYYSWERFFINEYAQVSVAPRLGTSHREFHRS